MIGIDSADYNAIQTLLKLGILPNLASLAGQQFRKLKSTIPPNTAPSWTSMFTGVNPGKHGIFYFKSLDDGRLLSSVDVKSPYLWEMFGTESKSIVVNVPLTYPVHHIHGVMISGLHATKAEPKSVFPTTLIPSVKSEYIFDMWDFEWASSLENDSSRAYEALLEGDSSRTNFFLKLLSREEWSFASLVLTSLDRVQHSFWNDGEKNHDTGLTMKVEGAYRFVDELLGRIGKALMTYDDLSFIVTSDHGFEDKRHILYPNICFAKNGLLTPRASSGIIDRTVSDVYRGMLKVLPTALAVWMGRTARPIFNRALSRSAELSPIDYNATSAYCYPYGLVRIPKMRGTVPIKEQTLHEITKKAIETIEKDLRINQVRGAKVLTGSQVYQGEFIGLAPDLVIAPVDSAEYLTDVFVPDNAATPHGDHSMDGIFLTNRLFSDAVEDFRVWDVAATIVSLLGFEVPSKFDGKCVVRTQKREFTRSLSLQPSKMNPKDASYSKEEENNIERRLKQLGYA